MSESLHVGDRIRFIRMPEKLGEAGYHVHRDTTRLYKRLIERRRSVRVYVIDASGLPWIQCRFRRRNGTWEHHFLAVVNDNSWVRVSRRF